VLNIAASWESAADDAPNVRWSRDCFEATQAFSTGGVYIDFLTEEEGRERIEPAYGKPNLGRLAALKKRYDPNNMFRHTKNISG
jgi:FAD/FMN-containing dehydrogenase